MRRLILVFLAIRAGLLAQERRVEPTWLYRGMCPSSTITRLT